MNILFIGGYDSGNYALVNLIKAFDKFGHGVRVVALFDNALNVRTFEANNISFMRASDFNEINLADFDAVCIAQNCPYSHPVLQKVKEAKKFIFTLANLFLTAYTIPYADLVFTLGDNLSKDFEEHYRLNCMAIGSPQYDSLKQGEDTEKKQILFIEQGLYPVGRHGREELAKLLIEMAERYSDYTICVKPRTLPNDRGKQVHKTLDHLYDYIRERGTKPHNLQLIDKYVDLEELINQSKCIVTLWSTAYIEAGIKGKHLLLLEGFPSEDCLEVRSRRVDLAYQKLRMSGCVIPYKEVFNYLPEGLPINKEYLYNEVFLENGNSSDKIVEVVEYIVQTFIKNKTVFPYLKTNYHNYRVVYREYANNILVKKSQNQLKLWLNREIDKITTERLLELVVFTNLKLNYLLENYCFDDIWKKADLYKQQIPENINNNFNVGQYLSQFETELKATLNTLLNRIIRVNMSAILRDKISQAFLFEFYYYSKNFDFFINFKDTEILAKEAYTFYYGRILCDTGCYEKAIHYFTEFIALEKNKSHRETHVDYDEFVISAIFHSGVALFSLKRYAAAKKRFLECREMTQGNHFKAEDYLQKCNRYLDTTNKKRL